MEKIKKLLGQRIKSIRVKRGISQQSLAEMIDIDQRNLSNIECGNTFPTKSLVKLAAALKITLPELFDFEHIEQNESTMKQYVHSAIDNLEPENLRIIYRLIKSMI